MFTYRNIQKNRFGLFVFSTLFVLSIVFVRQKQREKEELLKNYEHTANTLSPHIFDNIEKLKEKLTKLENENKVRTKELLQLKSKLKDKFDEDMVDALSLPSIFHSLPHLLGHKDALTPTLLLRKCQRRVNLAFGVPTVYREPQYLNQTLRSLVAGLTTEEKHDVVIIVFIGELNKEHYTKVLSGLRKHFEEAIESGLLEVLAPPRNFYPSLDNLPSTFNDPPERVKWRAKQNLDYAYLMMYAQSRAAYYVQLEDDIIATPNYASSILAFAIQNIDWFMLEFSSLGFIGKTFHASDLYQLVEFFMMYYKDKPNDWLLEHLLSLKVCNPAVDDKRECNLKKKQLRIRFKPSLFQHVGEISSLKGKKQELVDKEFKTDLLFLPHLNPKAIIKTNLEEYKSFTALCGYLGHSYLWVLSPRKNQVLRMSFLEPIKLKSFTFRTGNLDYPDDVLINATVEGVLSATYNRRKALKSGNDLNDINWPCKREDYVTLGHFNEQGLAKVEINDSLEPLGEIRLRVLKDIGHWVVFREIFIEGI